MKDVFENLVARALDVAPRARPRIRPRFARGTSGLIDERLLEIEALSRPGTTTAPTEQGAERESTGGREQVPPPRAAIAVTRELDGRTPKQNEGAPRAPVTGPELSVLKPVTPTVETVAERVASPRLSPEIVRPVLAPPPSLRSADRAFLSDPMLRRMTHVAGPRESARPAALPATVGAPRIDGDTGAVHISIGRIDVRATTVAAPVRRVLPARREPQVTLADYLRGRNEGR